MISNYLRTTLRYFKKNTFFVFVNLFGLIVGIGVCFFAYQYVKFELSYDRFNEHYDRIIRIVTDVETPSGTEYESSSAPMSAALSNEFPEVEKAARIYLDYLIINNNNEYSEENVAYADSTLFSVFTFPLIRGDPETALVEPFSLVISETAAKRFFGTTDCIGKMLHLDGNQPSKVTAVMRDISHRSHFRVDILVSMSTLLKEWNPRMNKQWTRFGFYTYLLLNSKVDPREFHEKIRDFPSRFIDNGNYNYVLNAEPMRDLYFHSLPRGSRTGSAVIGNIDNIYLFSLVAVLILALACFNFINLSTALALNRTREIGMRKVLGATRLQLSTQLLMDSILLSSLAFVVVLGLSVLIQPFFNELVGKNLGSGIFSHLSQLVVLFLIAMTTGLLAGIYPAVFLSRFKIVHCLKAKLLTNAGGSNFRRILVVLQFSASIIIIIFTLAVYMHLSYIQNFDLGFRNDPMVVLDFHFDSQVRNQENLLRTEFAAIPGVNGVSISSAIPGKANREFNTEIVNASSAPQEVLADVYFVDYNYLDQFGMDIVAGRKFSREIRGDFAKAMIVNETTVSTLGYSSPEDAIGKAFTQGNGTGIIIGVVKDFHFESIHQRVQPLTIRVHPALFTFVTFDIDAQNTMKIIAAIESKWGELVPSKPFLYFFLDEEYDSLYRSEQQFGQLFSILSSIAIIISCMGLFGFAAFSMSSRAKEIGIRKVMGSSVLHLVFVLNRDFLIIIAFAYLVSIPTSWYIIDQWLSSFAYTNGISALSFIIGGLSALGITLITVSYHTIRFTSVNPTEILRSD